MSGSSSVSRSVVVGCRLRPGSDSARETTATTSLRSNGFGRYSKAPFSAAVSAVISVFWALMTMIGKSGRNFFMRGMRSNAFSSGMTTSVMTTSPSPWLTQRQSVAALPVARGAKPARANAWFKTVRMAVSSSAISIVPLAIKSLSWSARRQAGCAASEAARGKPCVSVRFHIR